MAEIWGKNYFAKHAVPATPWCLEVIGCTQDVRCDGKIQVLGSGQSAAFPTRITHKLRPGSDSTDMTAELNFSRPTFEGLLAQTVRDAQRLSILSLLR